MVLKGSWQVIHSTEKRGVDCWQVICILNVVL